MGHKVLQYQSRFCSKLVDLDYRQVTQDVFKDLDSLRGPQWIVCLFLQQNNNQIFFQDFGTRKRWASMHLCSRGKGKISDYFCQFIHSKNTCLYM